MKWKKLGQVFDPTTWNDGIERDWMKSHSKCTSTLVFDDFVRIYFSSRYDNDKDGQATSVTSFLDVERSNLKKIIKVSNQPVMQLGKIGHFDENAIYPTSVIRHEGRVLLYYAGWSRCKSVPFNTSVGLAISEDDGETFKRYADGPVFGASPFEPFVISGPKIRKFGDTFFMYYLAGCEWVLQEEAPEIIYKNRMATSKDGIYWKRENRNIIADIYDNNECQAGPDVFEYKDKFNMYFVYRQGLNFRTEENRGYKIGYATSHDKYNWIRNDKLAGIEYSEKGWDSTMHHYPHVFELDGKHYMIYNGNDFGRFGFGLAVLED